MRENFPKKSSLPLPSILLQFWIHRHPSCCDMKNRLRLDFLLFFVSLIFFNLDNLVYVESKKAHESIGNQLEVPDNLKDQPPDNAFECGALLAPTLRGAIHCSSLDLFLPSRQSPSECQLSQESWTVGIHGDFRGYLR